MDLMSNPMLFDLTTDVGFALALNEIRRLKRGSCAVVAICCNSFTAMCLSCICVCVCGGYPVIVCRLPSCLQ